MVQIVASDELARQLEATQGIVEVVDARGKPLGTLTRPPSADDTRIANERRALNGRGMTTDELVRRLGASESP